VKSTTTNLLIFVMANSEFKDGVVTCYSREGEKRIKALVKDRATTKLVQARFFKTRKERWEYLLDKHPDLELIKDML
jgi:hypothetical protein